MSATLFDPAPEDVALTNDDWYTPRWLFDAAGLVFDVDVCAPVNPAYRTCPARQYLTVIEDGLTEPWHGLVWLNPPYSGSRSWVQRWTEHPTGLALVIAAQGTKGGSMLDLLLRAADGLAMLSGGVEFTRPGTGPVGLNFALALAARGSECQAALERVAARWSTPAWIKAPHNDRRLTTCHS